MKKLRLDLDSLEVESFDTAEADEKRGTVQARATAYPGGPSCVNTCNVNDWTCWESCGYGTCAGATCDGAWTCPTCEQTICWSCPE